MLRLFSFPIIIGIVVCLEDKMVIGSALEKSFLQDNKSNLSPEVEDLCDSYFNWKLENLPEFSTFLGIHDNDTLLDDLSEDAFQRRYDRINSFLLEAEKLEPNLTLHTDIINMRYFKADLLAFLDGYQYKGFYLLVNFLGGLQKDIPKLFEWMKKDTLSDFNKMISRLAAIGKQVDQVISLMKAGVNAGIVNHNISMNGVIEELDKFIVENPEDFPLFDFFSDFPSSISPQQINDIKRRAKEIITQFTSPAYKNLRDYIQNEYETRPEIALSSLPNGLNMYNALIRYHTSTTMTPEHIHRIGLEEVERIEGEMQKIVTELGHNMTVHEFSTMIRDDSSNFYNNETELIAGFEHIVFNRINPLLQHIFTNVPQSAFKIAADPSSTLTGYIISGSSDGSRPTVFYAGTKDLGTHPKYGMLTLSLHEASPGHYLHSDFITNSPNMPKSRRFAYRRYSGFPPSWFLTNTFFNEGWALYAETLGFDMNLFSDPLERYGYFSSEIFRACRLVVDTGIHALGWKRQQAIDFMFMHSAAPLADIKNQIDRYITWPGQALSYKMGQLKLSEFRANAEKDLGNLFNIKEFHDVILEAYGPLDIVEEEVNRWIQETLDRNL